MEAANLTVLVRLHNGSRNVCTQKMTMLTDADRVLLRGLPLRQARESLAILGLLYSRAQNESPLAWITREFREMLVIAPELQNRRLKYLRESAINFIRDNPPL